MSEKTNNFQQGYACAVASLIIIDLGVQTSTRELFLAGLGEYNLKKFRQWGIDEHDIEIFKRFRRELTR